MWEQRRRRVALALAENEGGDQRGRRSVHVHDGAAGEVPGAHVGQEPAAPHPVRQRGVHNDRPQRDEHDIGAEPHALDDGARNQGRGDDAERGLEGHVEGVRDGKRNDGAFLAQVNAAQEQIAQVPDEVL
jgi:hypothetical protein